MSDTEKRPYLQVFTVAKAISAALAPACHRIEVAGNGQVPVVVAAAWHLLTGIA